MITVHAVGFILVQKDKYKTYCVEYYVNLNCSIYYCAKQ